MPISLALDSGANAFVPDKKARLTNSADASGKNRARRRIPFFALSIVSPIQ